MEETLDDFLKKKLSHITNIKDLRNLLGSISYPTFRQWRKEPLRKRTVETLITLGAYCKPILYVAWKSED